MSDHHLLQALNAWGADPSRWPAEQRAEAERALASSPALRAARREEERFDRLLGGVPPVIDDARLARLLTAVGEAARAVPQDTLMVLLLGRMPRRMAASLCVALLTLGWLAGSLATPSSLPRSGTRDVALLSDDVTTLFDGDAR